MRVLVIADEESKSLWDFYDPSKLADIDLIISCGDLSPTLSFLVTMGKAPLLYVHGNHDVRYDRTPPDGCICIDDDIYEYKGLRILGLGGSMRYKPGPPYQFTEQEMKKRIRKLWFRLYKKKGFDILVSHAPAYHFHDAEDLPHQGFQCFIDLMEKYKPKYFLHGHNHLNYGGKATRIAAFNENTTVINAYQSYILDIDMDNE